MMRATALIGVVILLALPAVVTIRDITATGAATATLETREWSLLLRSLGISALTTALAIPMGLATALFALSARPTVARVVEWASYLPLLLPNIVVVLGWIHFAGVNGVATRALEALALETGGWLYGPFGVAVILALCNFPVVTLFSLRALRQLRPSAVRAALLHGRRWQTVRLLLGHVRSSITGAAALVFLLAFADFGVASALMVNVLPVEVFVQLNAFFDQDRALTVLSVPITVALLVALLRPRFPLGTASGVDRGFAGATNRLGTGVAGLTLLLALAIPLVFLIATAGGPGNYVRALQIAGEQFLNSQVVALWSLAIGLPLAVLFALGHARTPGWLRRIGESALLVLLVLPGGATGLGLLSLLGPAPHPSVLAFAAVCRYLAFPAFLIIVAMPRPDDARLRSAHLAGASGTTVFTRIVLPILRPTLVTAGAVLVVLSLGELSAAALLHPPGAMTLPVRLSSLLHFGEDAIVAALCIILTTFILTLLALGQLLSEPDGARR